MFQAWKNWTAKPLLKDSFITNGQLSTHQFKISGDHLTQMCKGWKWKPALNSVLKVNYLDQDKQFLIYERAICKSRICQAVIGKEEIITDAQGDDIVIIHPVQSQQKQIQEKQQQQIRFYNMYIVYDPYYHCPRMSFTAVNQDGKPISNQQIRQDIQKQYLNKTLTIEKFPFMDNVSMATVHPCKHSNVLDSMSRTMRENGQLVESNMALQIFLKFITSVIPTVQFDTTGELHFS